MIKKLFIALMLFLTPIIVLAQFTTPQGGTGTTSPSGILTGDGTLHLKTLTIGTNLTLTGTTLNATAGSATFPFTVQTYGNSTSTITAFLAGLISNGSTTITGLTDGLIGNQNGLLYSLASSSLFGFTPANNATSITVNGTGNQITSSAGAQDLSANRTWTLSLPKALQFPLSFTSTYGTTTYASSTALTASNLFFTNATGTSLAITGSTTVGGVLNAVGGANITNLSNFASNGFVKTSGSNGALSIDTNTYLTGNQSITLSGDVTGSGATAITTAYNNVVPTAKGGTNNASLTADQILYTNHTSSQVVTAASSSLFGFTPASNATALTINGTANQISSSAGSQDLSANRTWTFSLPAALQFPLSFTSTYGTTTYASSTALTTSNFWIAGQSAGCAQFDGSAKLTSTGVNCGTGSGFSTTSADYHLTATTTLPALAILRGLTTIGSGITGLVAGNAGVLYSLASSSLFGFTPASNATTLTINGTANQITSSVGAQDLSANRTWTFSLPAALQFPLSFTSLYGTTTYASSTALTTNNFWVTGQSAGCAQFDGSAKLTSTGVNCGSGTGSGFSTTSADFWITSTTTLPSLSTLVGLTTLKSTFNGILAANSGTLFSTATSSLFGTIGTPGQVLMVSNGKLVYAATSSVAAGTATTTLLGDSNTFTGVNRFIGLNASSTSHFDGADFISATTTMLNGMVVVDGIRYPHTGAGIQSAINSLPSTGGKVYIPSDTYIVSSPITISSDNVALEGANESTILKASVGFNNFIIKVDDSALRHNLTFHNLKFDGDRLDQTSGGCLMASSTVASLIDHVWFTGCKDVNLKIAGMAGGTFGSANTVVDSIFDNGGTIGIWTASNDENFIHNNTFSDFSQYAIFDTAGTQQISNNVFVGGSTWTTGTGIYTSSSNSRMMNNNFDGVKGPSISLQGNFNTANGNFISYLAGSDGLSAIINNGGENIIESNTVNGGTHYPYPYEEQGSALSTTLMGNYFGIGTSSGPKLNNSATSNAFFNNFDTASNPPNAVYWAQEDTGGNFHFNVPTGQQHIFTINGSNVLALNANGSTVAAATSTTIYNSGNANFGNTAAVKNDIVNIWGGGNQLGIYDSSGGSEWRLENSGGVFNFVQVGVRVASFFNTAGVFNASIGLISSASSTFSSGLTVTGGSLGVGTTTPGSILSIQGVANFVASALSTIYNGLVVATELVIPKTTATTVANSGDIAINTTTASSSMEFNNGSAFSLYPDGFGGLPYASSTLAYFGSYGAAGTTTIKMATPRRKTTLTDFYCETDSGTATAQLGNGSASTTVICTTTGADNAVSQAFAARAHLFLGIGDTTGTPNIITVTPSIMQNE